MNLISGNRPRFRAVRIVVVGVILFAFSVASGQERSEDRDKPTPVTSNEVTDDLNGSDDEYFYRFNAGPSG